MDFDWKIALGVTATLMTIWAHIPYLFQTIKGTNRPHIFTWIIWTLLTGIAFVAQVAGNAGPGAWVAAFTTILCVLISLAALKNGEKRITRGDWVMFLAGLCAIPVWVLTENPVWSVWIITVIDLVALYPTFRKSWLRPHEENSFMYGFNIPRHTITLFAMTSFTMTTALYPAALLLMNIFMYAMLKGRRRYLAKQVPIVN